jgi:hypothetical protein
VNETHVGVLLEQRSFFLCVLRFLIVREGGYDTVHEVDKFNAAASLRMRCNDLSGGDLERCKQSRGAVPLVVMALTG